MRESRSIFMMPFILIGLMLLLSCRDDGARALAEQRKRLAGELRDSKLYEAAIEEYQKILASKDLETKTRANINYLVAKIYFENLADYEQAAAYYVRARALNPKGSFFNEASKNLVASLEKMGQMLDAKRELDAVTGIDAAPGKQGDVAVARIGGAPIWLSEIERQIQSLPPDVQKEFMTREAKIEFMRQYVGIELMFRAAVRENYGEDPEIVEKQRQVYRKLLVDKYVLDNVIPEIKIDTMDVRNFYEANKEGRYRDAPYDSVRARVFIDYQGEKAEQAFSDYIARLARVEKVEFLEHNIR